MPTLSEQDQQEEIRYITATRPLLHRYHFQLFEDKPEAQKKTSGSENESQRGVW